jgi:hypothetical protein
MASAHGSAQDVTCWTAVDLKTLDWARADAPISEMGQSRRFRPVSVRSDLPSQLTLGGEPISLRWPISRSSLRPSNFLLSGPLDDLVEAPIGPVTELLSNGARLIL